MRATLYTDATCASDGRAAGGIVLVCGAALTACSVVLGEVADSNVAELRTMIEGIVWARSRGAVWLDVRCDNSIAVRAVAAVVGGAPHGVTRPRTIPAALPERFPPWFQRAARYLLEPHLERLVEAAGVVVEVRVCHSEEIRLCDSLARSALGLLGRNNVPFQTARLASKYQVTTA